MLHIKSSDQHFSLSSWTFKMFHNTGDKSVTMCGVAQELGEDKTAHTRPWHVTLTKTKNVSH